MIRFRDTCAEVTQFFEECKFIADMESSSDRLKNACSRGMGCFQTGKSRIDKSHECMTMLLGVDNQVSQTKVKGDRSKSVLFDACRLAS